MFLRVSVENNHTLLQLIKVCGDKHNWLFSLLFASKPQMIRRKETVVFGATVAWNRIAHLLEVRKDMEGCFKIKAELREK